MSSVYANRGSKKVFTSDHVAGAAKSAKRKAIEEKRKLATTSIAEIHEMKRQKREKAIQRKVQSGAFDKDLSSRDKQAPKKKASEANGEFVFKEKITSLRKQGKRSVHSFKSKARYNRRK